MLRILGVVDRCWFKDDLNLSARLWIFSCASGSTLALCAICCLEKMRCTNGCVLVEHIKFYMYCISFSFSYTSLEINVSLLFTCKPSKDIYVLFFLPQKYNE